MDNEFLLYHIYKKLNVEAAAVLFLMGCLVSWLYDLVMTPKRSRKKLLMPRRHRFKAVLLLKLLFRVQKTAFFHSLASLISQLWIHHFSFKREYLTYRDSTYLFFLVYHFAILTIYGNSPISNESPERVTQNHRLWVTRSEKKCGVFSAIFFQF